MTLDLVPWRRRRKDRSDVAVRRDNDPIQSLRSDIDTLLGNFFTDFGDSFGWPAVDETYALTPRVDVSESEDEVQVTADLPGLSEKDVEVVLDDTMLVISGQYERKEDTKKRSYRIMERSSGSFRRTIQLPAGLDPDNVRARFKRGTLTVTLPKLPEARGARRKVAIQTG